MYYALCVIVCGEVHYGIHVSRHVRNERRVHIAQYRYTVGFVFIVVEDTGGDPIEQVHRDRVGMLMPR